MAALGAGDCERIGLGLLAQPVNTLSSLAYVAAGSWLVATARAPGGRARAALGLAALLAGAGSADFHGPAWPGARWLHDLGIVALLAGMTATDVAVARGTAPERALPAAGAGVAAGGVLLAVAPGAGVPLAAGAALALAVAETAAWRRRPPARRRWARLALAALLAGAAVNLTGRTGGPLCDPDSLLQGHAAWHLLTAGAVAAWATATLDPPGPAS